MFKQCIGVAAGVAIVAFIYMKMNSEDFDPEIDVKGKNVIVTGASQGIGELIAYQYARMGANVFLTARREIQLKQVMQKCKKIGHNGVLFGYLAADMKMYDVTAGKVVKDAVTLFGGIDHVILNHAYIHESAIWKGTDEQLRLYKEVIDINTLSFVHLTSHALPYLKKSNHGRLGVISSISGKLDSPCLAAYSSSKFALDGFFSSLREELIIHKENISVTLCILGPIGTDAGYNVGKGLRKLCDMDTETFPLSIIFPIADPDDTAFEIIKSTSSGRRELYYPPVLGSRYIAQMYPALRHMF